MQFIVTDGATFTDLQSRDMTYTADADPTGMVCTITSKARNYTLTATYSTDPARDTVLVRTHLRGPSNLKLYVRLDPTVGGHGGGGADNAGADSATATPHRARRRRHDDADRGRQPRLRQADVPRPAGRQAVHVGERRLRGHRQRRAQATRQRPQAHDGVRQRAVRQRRHDRAGAARSHARARLRPHRRAGEQHRRPQPRHAVRPLARALPARVGALRRPARAPEPQARRGLLPRHQRRQGVRGQGVPGRRRRRARVAVGPGGSRGQPAGRQGAVLRLLPRGLQPRPLRGVHRAAGRGRSGHRPGHRALPARTPATGRRPDAAQQPAQRQDGAGHRRRPARRDRVPDPDGLPVGPVAATAGSTPTTSARRRTSSSPAARRSATSAGRSRAATRRRRSPPRSRAWSRPAGSRRPRTTTTARRSTSRPPTTSSVRSRAGR